MISFEPGPKIASTVSWSPDFAASRSALPASSGEANVFWPEPTAAAVPDFAQETRGMSKTKSNAKLAGEIVRRTRCDMFDLQGPNLIGVLPRNQFHGPELSDDFTYGHHENHHRR